MSDFFQGVTGDLNSMEEKVLGPQYNYAKNIKTPQTIPPNLLKSSKTPQHTHIQPRNLSTNII